MNKSKKTFYKAPSKVVNIKPYHEALSTNVFTKLWYIFVKDLKILVRSRVSALIFFLGPIIITLMASLAFNASSLYDVNVAVYSDAYSPLSESVITGLTGSGYSINKVHSITECVDSIRVDEAQICIIFPPNMAAGNSTEKSIELYVDNSRINIADQLVNVLGSKVDAESDEISTGMVKALLTVVDSINKEVSQRKSTISALSEANSESLAKLESTTGKLDSLGASHTPFDKGAVTSEISSLAAGSNVTNLNASVLGLIAAYSDAVSKLNNINSKTAEISEDINAVRNILVSDKTRIQTISDSITVISNDIVSIKITNAGTIVHPVSTSIHPIIRTNNYLAYVFPSLVAVIVMFLGMLMSSTTVFNERKSNAYFRNFISPTSNFLLIVGRYITLLLIIAFEIALILLIGSLFLKNVSLFSYLIIGLVLLVEASVFIFLGMLIGYLFDTGESVTVASISTSTVLLFLSGVVLPIEIMSGVLRSIVHYNPFVIAENSVKKVLLFGLGLSDVYYSLGLLVVMALIFSIFTIAIWYLHRHFEV